MGAGVELGLEGWIDYGYTGSLFTEAEIVIMGAAQGKNLALSFLYVFKEDCFWVSVAELNYYIYNSLEVNILIGDIVGYRSMKVSADVMNHLFYEMD